MLIRVKTESVREVFLAIDNYEAETKERLARAVNRSLNAIRRGAKARIHSRSGYLAKRIRKTFDARVISGTVRSTPRMRISSSSERTAFEWRGARQSCARQIPSAQNRRSGSLGAACRKQ